MRQRTITTCGKQVLADGEELAQARNSEAAEWIGNALQLQQLAWFTDGGSEDSKRYAVLGVALGLVVGIPLGALLGGSF